MKKTLLFLTFLLSISPLVAQKNNVWQKVSVSTIQETAKIRSTSYSENQQFFTFDSAKLMLSLSNVSDKLSGQQGVSVIFPSSDGKLETFLVWENSNFAPELQAQYPLIKSFIGKGVTDPSATINFSLSPTGIQTMILRADKGSEFIEPFTKDNKIYVLFDSKTRNTAKLPFNCSTVETSLNEELLDEVNTLNRSNNRSYKTMRLALSCVGEYGQFYGSTIAGALAGMNATMTRVNGVLERDLAVHLNIIANNNLVIYTNPNTDPYSPGPTGSGGAWNAELQNTLRTVIGEANYDIGHLFGASGGGGNAGCIGCVCVDGPNPGDTEKGSGFTSPSNNIPQGDTFDIDYVVHEMGHQLGATHSFSFNVESSGTNVEPGSGSTIMGYAGITDFDVQSNSDAYFVYRNIIQIQTNLVGKTCPVSVETVNFPPVVSAGADFTVPKGTAYVLKGIATDQEGDIMTYTWEQNNSAPTSQSGANSVASPTKVSGPNFRSFTPTASIDRYMPARATVIAGNLSTMWESVSNVARTSRFFLTARDNNVTGPQTNSDDVVVSTSATAGPFTFGSITGRNTNAVTTWNPGETQTINWNVNNTNTLVGAANVNIKFSIDGGQTFPYDLVLNTPNDGSEEIIVPTTPVSQNCRLLIEPTANVFYALNSPLNPIFTGYSVSNQCTTYTYNGAAFSVPDNVNSYIVKTIPISSTGLISDVNVKVNATHPNLQNLVIAMSSPTSGPLVIYNQQCATSADMDVTFDAQGSAFACASPLVGALIPPGAGNLNVLNVNPPAGNWSFAFKDVVAGNTGTINSIELTICKETIVLTSLASESFTFKDFALYPNPNNGAFNVSFNSNASNKITINVVDLSGRTIFNEIYSNTTLFNQEIKLDKASSGIYLVTIADGDQKIVRKIIIE